MIEIIPALLVHDQQTFEYRLKQVLPLTNFVQVDVLDGTFVKNHTWFDTVNLIEEDFNVKYWLHLMVDDPILYVTNFPSVEIRHIEGITAHIEKLADEKLDTYVDLVKSLGVKVGLAGNLDFSDIDLSKYDLDELLIMGVEPGYSGQAVLDDTVNRVRQASGKAKIIAVDGGVNDDNIDKLIDAGVNRVYLASYVFNNDNPKKVFSELKNRYV